MTYPNRVIDEEADDGNIREFLRERLGLGCTEADWTVERREVIEQEPPEKDADDVRRRLDGFGAKVRITNLDEYNVTGTVTHEDAPFANVSAIAYQPKLWSAMLLRENTTDNEGTYEIEFMPKLLAQLDRDREVRRDMGNPM